MTRREVELARAEWYRAELKVRELVREHNEALHLLLQRAAQLENVYSAARRQLHAELDAQRD